MRYVVYGAGAIGGTIGARLLMAGYEVTLIARGPHLERIQHDGLVFSEPNGTTTLDIPAAAHPDDVEFTDGDVVILAMKSQDTQSAVDALAAAAPPSIHVVCAQNGVNNERVALRSFANVHACFVVVAADHLEPGVVHRFGSPFVGILDLGRYPQGADDATERIGSDFRRAGFRCTVDPAVMLAKYRKLHFNLGNVVQALLGGGDRGDLGGIADRARREADAVFAAAGIEMMSLETERRRRAGLQTVPSQRGKRMGGSSWQSLARGTGSIETPYLNGEVVLLGRLYGVPTPVNEVLCEQARVLAQAKAAPGTLELAQVEALIEARQST